VVFGAAERGSIRRQVGAGRLKDHDARRRQSQMRDGMIRHGANGVLKDTKRARLRGIRDSAPRADEAHGASSASAPHPTLTATRVTGATNRSSPRHGFDVDNRIRSFSRSLPDRDRCSGCCRRRDILPSGAGEIVFGDNASSGDGER
jgi:hypothetical protein